jgi:hypothetical protein
MIKCAFFCFAFKIWIFISWLLFLLVIFLLLFYFNSFILVILSSFILHHILNNLIIGFEDSFTKARGMKLAKNYHHSNQAMIKHLISPH